MFCSVRDEWRQGQTAIVTQVLLLTIAALLPHLGLGFLNQGGGAEGRSPQSASWFSGIAVSTASMAAGTLPKFFPNVQLLLLFFGLFTLVHLLIDGSVEGQYIIFGCVWFYGISTIVGYIMPNLLYTCLLNPYDLLTHFLDDIFNELQLFFSSKLNGFTYLYQLRIILFIINNLFAHSSMVSSIAI